MLDSGLERRAGLVLDGSPSASRYVPVQAHEPICAGYYAVGAYKERLGVYLWYPNACPNWEIYKIYLKYT